MPNGWEYDDGRRALGSVFYVLCSAWCAAQRTIAQSHIRSAHNVPAKLSMSLRIECVLIRYTRPTHNMSTRAFRAFTAFKAFREFWTQSIRDFWDVLDWGWRPRRGRWRVTCILNLIPSILLISFSDPGASTGLRNCRRDWSHL